jgi:Haem-NO-binding
MLGWINDCIEKLVLNKFDLETWHAVKEKAGLSDIKDGGFLKLESYPLKTTTDLVQAASELSGLTVPQVYEVSIELTDSHTSKFLDAASHT